MQYLGTIPILQALGVFVGFFAISPPIGYVVYQFYDGTLYRILSKCKKKRIALQLIDKWAEEEKVSSLFDDVKRKELIDFALYFSFRKSRFKVSEKLGETIRGFWSHANARLVCSIYVPLFSLLIFLGLVIANLILSWNIFTLELWRTLVILFSIVAFSFFLGYPAWETIQEAFALEEYLVRVREQEIREYMKKPKSEKIPTEERKELWEF